MAGKDNTPRVDGGYNYTDKRGRLWAYYAPGATGPTRTVQRALNGLPVPGQTVEELMWPSATNWRACLRVISYGEPAFTHLVSGKSEMNVQDQIEWFAEERLPLGQKPASPWLVVACVVLGLMAMDGKGKRGRR